MNAREQCAPGLAQVKYDYTNRIVLVTGAGGGIGRAAAIAFAQAGAQLVLVDLHPAGLQASVACLDGLGLPPLSMQLDISDAKHIKELFDAISQQYGRLDFAFNNAGVEEEAQPLGLGDEALFDRIMRVNVKGVWLCMRAELEMMQKHSCGVIVNTASVAGLASAPRQAIYAASKHAVVGLTKSAAVEYARHGIRINSICPGVVETEMMDRAIARDPARADYIAKLHPIGRVAQADEVAQAALWLCSDGASFVTGHQLTVDGGLLA
ncbi:glucose 1-dehydrogenase [Massilia sp. W12]|uniref:glucose 1-dehydrogenase n=1 Tax=Massilia sp. W12 TaxID=3126507 RepID=UPI0030D4958E